jgi:hypothetical protein
MSVLGRTTVLLARFLSEIGALGCAVLVRYVGEPEPGATPAA